MRIALKNVSRRYWEFAIDGDLVIDDNGIKAKNGILRMPTNYAENVIKDKQTFETEEECWEWIQRARC